MRINQYLWLLILMGILLLWGKSENALSVVLLTIGMGILYASATQRPKNKHSRVGKISLPPFGLGVMIVVFGLMLLPNFWLIVLLLIIGYGVYQLKKNSGPGKSTAQREGQLKYIAVQSDAAPDSPDQRSQFFDPDSWFFNQQLGKEIYPWENFHYYSVNGDLLIDFTNTIVPRQTNIIGLHKVIGNIKLIIPAGIGVSLHLNSYRASLSWQGKRYAIENEKFILENEAYQSNPRKIHLTITLGWGNVEVIFL